MPSDINNPVDRAAEPHFGTLPKALTKKVPCQENPRPGSLSVTHAQGGRPEGSVMLQPGCMAGGQPVGIPCLATA